MKKEHLDNMKTVDEYNEFATEIIDCWLEDFQQREGLTREPNEDDLDIFDGGVGFMYTQAGMKLYDSAVRRLTSLGEKLFPDKIIYFTCSNMKFP